MPPNNFWDIFKIHGIDNNNDNDLDDYDLDDGDDEYGTQIVLY